MTTTTAIPHLYRVDRPKNVLGNEPAPANEAAGGSQTGDMCHMRQVSPKVAVTSHDHRTRDASREIIHNSD
jgi:hypothetical protein